MIREKLGHYANLVAFSHTIFAMPFAASAVVLAHSEPHVPLTIARVLALVFCMVSARSAAMAFNRYIDRDIDADNPRTSSRDIPAGRVSPREALALTIASSLAFVAGASALGRLPGLLALPVLAVLLGYSLAKRFTWAAHLWLGVALALAPGGAWIAMGAAPNLGIVSLMVAVVTWLFGFDVLYSLQDEQFDRARGLHSVPSRFGMRRALWLSGFAHVVTALAFAATGLLLHRGAFYFAAVALATVLLAWEHWIVGAGDLSRIDKAFFDINAWIAVGFFALVLADELARR
jgi:4-hydroxybenzoate polyprenyltransferase